MLAVCGNHDYPLRPLPVIPEGLDSWPAFQEALLERAAGLEVSVRAAPSGAYRAFVDGTVSYHSFGADEIRMHARGISTGAWMARGAYRFALHPQAGGSHHA